MSLRNAVIAGNSQDGIQSSGCFLGLKEILQKCFEVMRWGDKSRGQSRCAVKVSSHSRHDS